MLIIFVGQLIKSENCTYRKLDHDFLLSILCSRQRVFQVSNIFLLITPIVNETLFSSTNIFLSFFYIFVSFY